MEQYIIDITDEALADMEDIYNYIAFTLLSPENARGQYDRIADAIFRLETLPSRVKVMDFEPDKEKGLRQLFVDNYSVLYVIDGNYVHVTNVLYSASDIAFRLKKETDKK